MQLCRVILCGLYCDTHTPNVEHVRELMIFEGACCDREGFERGVYQGSASLQSRAAQEENPFKPEVYIGMLKS